jgi:CSLREA domain-containing protein
MIPEASLGSETKVKALGLLAALLMAAGLLLLAAAKPAYATPATFTVNTASDTSAANDGACQSRSIFIPRGDCTLREAINAANSNSNPADTDLIRFSIPTNGPHTIFVGSGSPSLGALPAISQPVTINGYTEPGATPNTATDASTNAVLMIVLSGQNAPSGSSNGVRGLVITGGGTTIKGLVVNNFKLSNRGLNGEGISVRSDNNVIEGNFVGTDVNGTADQGNQGIGILVASGKTGNKIGGTTPAARNLSSGNGYSGVEVDGSSNTVQGNLLGTKKDGVSDLGNDGRGVLIQGANNTVGGNTDGEANTIAFNGLGVSVRGIASTGNRIFRNSIFSNSGFGSGLGIDLGEDGPTANDAQDPDTGPNTLQNKPNLTSATTTTVQGNLNSTPDTTFVIRFFSNPSGNEGKTYNRQTSVTTDNAGDASFTVTLANAVPVGENITATATGPGGNTSEFSAPRTVVRAG